MYCDNALIYILNTPILFRDIFEIRYCPCVFLYLILPTKKSYRSPVPLGIMFPYAIYRRITTNSNRLYLPKYSISLSEIFVSKKLRVN